MSCTAAQTGQWGERMAARRYLQMGYTLLAHNYRTRMGELDLVLCSPQQTLVICEVKTRRKNAMVSPAQAVDAAKQRRLIAAAKQYLQHTKQTEMLVRFDVAEVIPLDSGRAMVHIIENAFVCE
jgi:putative endonuclease